MNTRLIVTFCFVAALAFACGPRSRTAAFPVTPTAVAVPTHTTTANAADSGTTTRSNEETITTTFDVSQAPGHVDLALAVTNASKKRLEVNFTGGQTYDFVIVDSVGREVWRWGAGRIFTQSVQNKLLGHGDSMHMSERWTSGRPGKYVAIATLRSSNFPVEHRVAFELR
jgi:hypothetical protein